MKAAVIYNREGLPEYADMPEPLVKKEGETLVSVKAAALKHFDRGRAKGTHYSSAENKGESKSAAQIIGGDGVCLLEDGSRVYALGSTGMLAEKAIVEKDRIVPLPEGLDDAIGAALPNAVYGSAMALKFRGEINPGDTVLVNGATGFTGRVAVQIARHYGAGKIIATGRNPASLQELTALGADEIISTDQPGEEFTGRLRQVHQQSPINLVIDYLWGKTAELILASLKGNGSFTPKTNYVSVGSITGDLIQLSAASLRSADIRIAGSGLGSWTKSQVGVLFREILPEMFQLAADGKLLIETENVALRDIEKCWEWNPGEGKRLVVQI